MEATTRQMFKIILCLRDAKTSYFQIPSTTWIRMWPPILTIITSMSKSLGPQAIHRAKIGSQTSSHKFASSPTPESLTKTNGLDCLQAATDTTSHRITTPLCAEKNSPPWKWMAPVQPLMEGSMGLSWKSSCFGMLSCQSYPVQTFTFASGKLLNKKGWDTISINVGRETILAKAQAVWPLIRCGADMMMASAQWWAQPLQPR